MCSSDLKGGRLVELEAQVGQLRESNAEFVSTWDAQRRGAEAVGFDLDTLLGGLARVTELQRDVVELEESNAALQQSGSLSEQKVSALEVDLEDFEEKVSAARNSEGERAAQVEQLVDQIEALEASNQELAAIGEHSSERIGSLETELEEFEAEGLASEESVRVQREEIELLLAQISELQDSEGSGGSVGGISEYEIPAGRAGDVRDLETGGEGSGVPAGHDPEDYEVDDRPSWES